MQYLHIQIDRDRIDYGGNRTLSEKLLDYKGKQLLAIQKLSRTEQPWVLVPGFVINYQKRKTSEGIRVSEVSEVPKELRKIIVEFLYEQSFRGAVDFW